MSNFKYKISVIIPVYNCESHLESCMDSLKKQTMAQEDFQIVFINDGSTDNSDKICLKLKDENNNVLYFKKENGGVSSARNKGLELAEGKYIIFLDADDALSENSLESIYKFFELNNEKVDIVTYSIDYLSETGDVTTHKRYDIMDCTGIYDINSDPNIMQTTMNVCVKNVDASQRILFDESLTLGEDQLFIFSWISRKQKIGFVKDATYTYFRHSGSASSIYNNPYYCFDQYINFFNKLLSVLTTASGKPHQTAQAMVVYNLGWRITSDTLVCHTDSETEQKQLEIIKQLLEKIDDEIILHSIYIDPYHVECFMRLKGIDFDYAVNNTTLSVFSGNRLWFSQPHTIVFGAMRVLKDSFYVSGYVKNGVIPYNEIKLFYSDENNELVEVPLTATSFSYYKSKAETNSFGGFDICVKLSDFNCFNFKIKIGDVLVTPAVFFSFRCVINSNKTVAPCGKYRLEFDKKSKSIFVKKADSTELAQAANMADNAVRKESRNAFAYRKIARKLKKSEPIWLYCDRENIFDNAYHQFLHDFDLKDGVKRYYIIDGLKDKRKYFTKAQRKYLVDFKSFKHKILFINSQKILTSFNSLSIVSPFNGLPLKWYYDMMDTEIIYLQHGVLHAYLPLLYSKEKAYVDKVVISSEFEKKNFKEIYRFKDADLLFSGMPRFDTIDVTKPASKKILFSPSWRKNLIGEYINNSRTLLVDKFLNSPFYKEIDSFLNSKELADLLEKYDLTLDFKNHPIFRDYDKYIKVDNPRINVTQNNINMQDYLVMITDYSSVVFDFVYLSRPIIYFVPDYEQFRAGVTHGYNRLDLPLEEGFGDITENGNDLLNALASLAQNNFEPSPKYKKRMDDFFGERNCNHAENLYKLLK